MELNDEREIEEGKLVVRTLPKGDREWRLDGRLHGAVGGFAVEYTEGGGECWLEGEHLFTSPPPHREDWREVQGDPIVTVRPNGDREWRVEGKLHREDGPAVEYTEGGGEWWLHGVNHREDGPAAVFPDGSFAWYRNGLLDRVDGPALWEPGGRVGWYRNCLRRSGRREVVPPSRGRNPLGLLVRLLLLPLDHVPLDLAEDRPVFAPVEVLDDRVRMVVVVERLARGELVAAAPPRSNRIAIPGFPDSITRGM